MSITVTSKRKSKSSTGSSGGVYISGVGGVSVTNTSEILTKLLSVDTDNSGLNANYLQGHDASYFLPATGGDIAGNVKIIGDLHVTGNITAEKKICAYIAGVISSSLWDSLPAATETSLGGIKVGTTLSISNGVLNIASGTGFDLTKDYAPSGAWNYSQTPKVGGVAVSLLGHGHAISDVSGLQTALDNINSVMSTDSERLAAVAQLTSAYQSADTTLNNTLTTALTAKAPLNSPNFTGTVTGITAAMIGLGNVTNNAQWYSGSHPTTLAGYGITDAASSSHTHSYAASASAGGAASSVASSIILKINGGTTEGTNLYTYNGSSAKTLNLVSGSNIAFSAASGQLTISSSYNNYYPTAFAWTGGTTAGPTGSLTGTGMPAVSFSAIPSASASASGIVTTGDQTFAGNKTYNGNLTVAADKYILAGGGNITLGNGNVNETTEYGIFGGSDDAIATRGGVTNDFYYAGGRICIEDDGNVIIKNTAGTQIATIDQSGNLLVTGKIAAYA